MFWKKYGDYVTSCFFILISIGMYMMAVALPKSKIMSIGPDFMPKLVSTVTGALAVLLLVKTIYKSRKNGSATAEESPEDCDYKKMLSSLILILIYVFIFQPAGFILATMLYLICQFIVLAPPPERTKKKIIGLVIIDVVFTLVVFYLFRYGFEIVLPAGLLSI
jgi:putative tricarboxylic transport membrane protein